ncbi:MaoC family dehydratase [Bacillus sp. JJ1503]|uniref:MaoC family dehydratase n=1 Tax=Bacillus sp. JJ1503 TaxID=3122956 RepID=UPI002FFFBAFC
MNETAYVSEQYKITQELINDFARASGGYGKIHVDPEHAKKTRFKTTLAHGFHLAALIEKELTSLFPNWKSKGVLEVKFVKAVKVEQEFRIYLERDETENQLNVTLRSDNGEVFVVGTASK